jgi:D-lactate dehydrogenase
MKIAFFSIKKWELDYFTRMKPDNLDISFYETKLKLDTVSLTKGFDGVCIFVNDDLNNEVIKKLAEENVKFIALRCSGFNNVDITTAFNYNIHVVRVPAYSPYAVAEHALGLILALNRKYYRSYSRVKEANFSIDGLMGFDLHNKTVGVIGTGKIGQVFIKILQGFSCKVLAYDKYPKYEFENEYIKYADLETVYSESDIISLHCPLNQETYHVINNHAISLMKKGVMIINTSRGALIDTEAVIDGLKKEIIGYVGLDVYEEEGDLFFEDLSNKVIQDDVFVRLQYFPNVLITAHQGFFTKEAIENIVYKTYKNIESIRNNKPENLVLPSSLIKK